MPQRQSSTWLTKEAARAQREWYVIDLEGVVQPAPAPRFSRTDPVIQNPPPRPGEDTENVFKAFGFSADKIEALKAAGAI